MIPSAVAKSKQPFPGMDSANLLHVLMIPDCVGPGAVILVALAVLDVELGWVSTSIQ